MLHLSSSPNQRSPLQYGMKTCPREIKMAVWTVADVCFCALHSRTTLSGSIQDRGSAQNHWKTGAPMSQNKHPDQEVRQLDIDS